MRSIQFATFLTPGSQGGSWDTARICAFGEVLAFYGLGYWYTWQVSILGLGPIARADAITGGHVPAITTGLRVIEGVLSHL